jgi:hypothetical protein
MSKEDLLKLIRQLAETENKQWIDAPRVELADISYAAPCASRSHRIAVRATTLGRALDSKFRLDFETELCDACAALLKSRRTLLDKRAARPISM